MDQKVDLKKLNQDLKSMMNFALVFEEKSLDENIIKDLTLKEIHILDSISKEPNHPMSYYAVMWKVTLGAFMTCIRHLEEKEYVVKVADGVDKRITRLNVTKKASKAIKEHNEFHKDLLARMLEKCSEKEVSNFLTAFNSIITENYRPTKTEVYMIERGNK